MRDLEKKWVGAQKQFQTAKMLENVGKRKKKQSKYTQKCLYLCKSWNRPAIRIDELREILKANCGKAENIVQIELSYYRGTYKADVVQQPDLFSINKISHEERLLNLCALLSEHEPLSNYVKVILCNTWE